HYRADISNFFGLDLARLLPFNIARTWHLQLAIFWVATSYLAAGIFLVPMITGREPRGQGGLAYALLAALALVVFGSLAGEFAGNRAAKISFWSLNIGLAWMVFATLFPLGILQLYHSVSYGYFDARTLKFLGQPTNALIE